MISYGGFNEILLDTIPNPIFYKDKNGKYIGCNKAFEDLFGINKKWIVGKTVYDISPLDITNEYYKSDIILFSKGGSHSYEGLVKSNNGGEIRNIIINKSTFYDRDGNIDGIVGVITDITERKKIELELAESEKKCKELSNLLPQTVYEMDSNGIITYLNKSAYEMFGITCEDFNNGIYFKDFIHPNYIDTAVEAFKRILSGGEIIKGKKYLCIKKNIKEFFPALIYSSPIKNNKGDIVGVRGIVVDHTDHETILNDLIETQENFRSLSIQYQFILDSIPDMVWTKDIHNNFTFVNKAMRDVLKKEADEIIGKSIFDITDEVDDNVIDSEILAMNMETCHFIESFKVNGDNIWLDVTKAPIIKDGKLVGTIGTARDITQKIENEKFLESYIAKEVEEWSKEKDVITAKIDKSISKIQSNIQKLKRQ